MDNPWSLSSSPSSHAEKRYTFEESGEIRRPMKGHADAAQPINADAAISHFPPELLSKIFLICAALSPTDELDNRTRDQDQNHFECADNLPWIAIAQVCRYWRSIVLGCGELWRRLVFSSPEATSEMVRRSNGVPLIVQAEGYDGTLYENIRMVISDMQRVSVLHLSFPPYHLQHILQELSATAPQLESFRLRTPSYYTRGRGILNFDFSGDSFKMPDFIYTPSLRLLELTRCNFSWKPLPLCGLTHLELRKISPPPTIAQIISFLRGLPILNTLILEEALPTFLPNDTSPDNPPPRQLLRNLHALTLCGNIDACSRFLKQLCYAPATAVTLKYDISSSSSPNFGELLRAAESAATFGGGDRLIRSLLVANGSGHLIFSHSATSLSSSNVPRLTIIMGGQNYFLRGVDSNHLVRSTVIVLPIAEVQMLYLSGGLLSIDWSELLHHLPKIHTIHIRHAFPINFINLLAGGVEQTMGPRPVTVLLPQLRSLWLTDVDFRASGCTPESFLACLRSRAQVDSAIQDLHIQDCLCLYDREVEKMKEFVQDVDWDEIEQDNPYDYDGGGNDYEGIDNFD